MFICKLRTPSCANHEHFNVYLVNKIQTGTVVTRQTYDRAPRLTKPPTAHISMGDIAHHLTCTFRHTQIIHLVRGAMAKFVNIHIVNIIHSQIIPVALHSCILITNTVSVVKIASFHQYSIDTSKAVVLHCCWLSSLRLNVNTSSVCV